MLNISRRVRDCRYAQDTFSQLLMRLMNEVIFLSKRFEKIHLRLPSFFLIVSRGEYFEGPINHGNTFCMSYDGFHNFWLPFCGEN
jgi:hypothetical protein